MKSLIIGDPHFKKGKEIEGEEYIKKVVEIAENIDLLL